MQRVDAGLRESFRRGRQDSLISVRYSCQFKRFDERTVNRPGVWSGAYDQSVESLSGIQIGDHFPFLVKAFVLDGERYTRRSDGRPLCMESSTEVVAGVPQVVYKVPPQYFCLGPQKSKAAKPETKAFRRPEFHSTRISLPLRKTLW